MDGRTDARTDTGTHGQRENSIPTTNKVCGGYKNKKRQNFDYNKSVHLILLLNDKVKVKVWSVKRKISTVCRKVNVNIDVISHKFIYTIALFMKKKSLSNIQ